MNVLVTGAYGFLGKHVSLRCSELGYQVIKFGRKDTDLKSKISEADLIFHLAGVNRSEDETDFSNINVGLTQLIIDELKGVKKKIPICFASSYQAGNKSPYGISKLKAEEVLIAFSKEFKNPLYIFRLPGVFGKWSKPYYNSVIATFIHQIHHDKELTIHDPSTEISVAYIDDVLNSMFLPLEEASNSIYHDVRPTFTLTLEDLASTLQSFKEAEKKLFVPDLSDSFSKKLYSTYISFKPIDKCSKSLQMNLDERGSFTEILKQSGFGQVSVNITHPGIEKGHHYHHHKHEKYLVVSGTATIELRDYFTDEKFSFHVSEDKLEIIDILPGYVHSIKNTGNKDLVTIMWVNELFDPEKPDTIYKKV